MTVPAEGPPAPREDEALAPALAGQLDRLRELVREAGPSVVAFSGGVDSALVLAVASEVLGDGAIPLTATGPTLPAEEEAEARAFVEELGLEHVLVPSHELEDPGYASNPTNRCYFCKTELYRITARVAGERGVASVLDGVNHDDLGDHRPGLQAAREAGVVHPLAELGLGKEAVRALARHLGVRLWDKPAFACLGSRFPYGTEITLERLTRLERCERLVRGLGFSGFRVRFHDRIARLELRADDLPRAVDPAVREPLIEGLKAEGFDFVTLDLEGYRSGSLNVHLQQSA